MSEIALDEHNWIIYIEKTFLKNTFKINPKKLSN